MKRTASAVWRGDLKSGKGAISTESGALKQTQYSFGTRFENGVGTNPEELIAAAHAGCFSMAFSAELGKVGITPDLIITSATITMENSEAGYTVTQSHLDVIAKVPGADETKIIEIASRQGGLPHLSPAKGEHHDGRDAADLNTPGAEPANAHQGTFRRIP